MRHFLFLICTAILLVGSGCFGAGNSTPNSDTTERVLPTVASSVSGVSLQVTSVERDAEVIRIVLHSINGSDNRINLAGNNDTLILRDSFGNEYATKEENIELQPLTVNDISVEFLGEVQSDSGVFSLTTNTKTSNDTTSPRLTIETIPVPTSGKLSFAPDENAEKPQPVALQGKSINHPNGTSFTVQNITFGADTIEIGFQTVNGSKSKNSFSTRNNATFLQDEKSNRYFLIPPTSGNKIELPETQKMSGTFRFAGKIPADVKNLTLYVNDGAGGDNEYTNSPKFIINDIPTGR